MNTAATTIYNRMTLVEKMELLSANPDGIAWHAHNTYRTDMMMQNVPETDRENTLIEIVNAVRNVNRNSPEKLFI